MEEQIKIALLIERTEQLKDNVSLLSAEIAALHRQVQHLPIEIRDTINNECITRREFRAAKGSIAGLGGIISLIVSVAANLFAK